MGAKNSDSLPCIGASAFLKSVDFGAFAVNVKTIAPKKYLYQSGHAIWWGEAPHIVYSFVENVSLKKKTVIPFSTSISSGLGSSGKHLKAKAQISSKTKWMKGRNFYDVPSQKTVNKWVKSLKY